MISTPLVRRRGRVLSGTLAIVAASALTACATPMFRTEARTTEDTLPPLAGTVPPSVVAGEPLLQSEPPIPVGTSRQGDDSATTVADPLAGRVSPEVRKGLDAFFPTLARLLTSTSLGTTTAQHGITLLAPTEVSFAHLPGEFVRNLVAHRDDVDHVLARHILDGVYTYDQLAEMDTVQTIGGDTLTVSHWWDGTVLIDGARVYPAVTGTGGDGTLVVYPVDRVLLDRL